MGKEGSTLVVSSYTQSNFESCSSAINRFNRKWFRTLSQPFSVETRLLLGIVVTRLPCNLPVRGLITQVTRSFLRPQKQQRPLPMLFNRFNPIWCGLKKLSNPKRFFFWQQNTKQLNQPNQTETVDPNRTRPWCLSVVFYTLNKEQQFEIQAKNKFLFLGRNSFWKSFKLKWITWKMRNKLSWGVLFLLLFFFSIN